MSETKPVDTFEPHIFRLFAGFQNYESFEVFPYASFLWRQEIYVKEIKFLLLESEDECRPYFQSNRWKTVLYSEWTRSLNVDVFLATTSTTLTSFFILNSLDIPKSFKRIRSLMRPTSSTVFSKLSAMLTKHGRKSYMLRTLSVNLVRLASLQPLYDTSEHFYLNWLSFYQVFTTLKLIGPLSTHLASTFLKRSLHVELSEWHAQYSSSVTKQSSHHNVYAHQFLGAIKDYTPLFSFFIKKVSKLQWKHSRGKSGRYLIKWKYIPVYKRLITLLRWLVSDVHFQNHHNFYDRLHASLKNLWFHPSSHLIIQFRRFVHKYVFQRCRNTLLIKLHVET